MKAITACNRCKQEKPLYREWAGLCIDCARMVGPRKGVGTSILTHYQAMEIRELLLKGKSMAYLAKEYRVSTTAISAIRSGRSFNESYRFNFRLKP